MKINNLLLMFLIGLLVIFTIISSYDLMGNPKNIPSQVGFGLVYTTYAFYFILTNMKRIRNNAISIAKLKKLGEGFSHIYNIFLGVFAFYSAFLLILALQGILNNIFSIIWLILVIVMAQGAAFVYLLKYSYKHKEITSLIIFFCIYLILTNLFGFTSAYICHDILKLPFQQDMFFLTYGQLILPAILAIYLNYMNK